MAGALIARPFSGEADLQTMIELTQALRAAGQMIYPIASDLYEELADPEAQATARLWENEGGQLIGFVYVNRWQNLVDVFAASEFTPAIETEAMDWGTIAMQRRNQEKGQSQTLDAGARESDLARMALLERHGFERQAETSLLMARSLAQPFPQPQLPAGFSIRPMGGETELEAYVALHRAAFGTEHMTVEYRRTIMRSPDYLPELDLVAVTQDGELAAFCMCQIFADDTPRAGGQKEGWTDPIGTHPSFQRRGLAKALMLTGLQLLQARGIDTALLGTSSENQAMQRTAEAIGFHTAAKTVWFCKTV